MNAETCSDENASVGVLSAPDFQISKSPRKGKQLGVPAFTLMANSQEEGEEETIQEFQTRQDYVLRPYLRRANNSDSKEPSLGDFVTDILLPRMY